MGFKYLGDAILNVALTVDAPKPLDVRSVVNNISELYDIPAKTAYPGMTVANIDNGNIYMLVDKSKITEKSGWKASYESILIITCTQAEYDEWSANTTIDFKPIDESKTYLHSETYYYIFEDDQGQYYLSSSWGKTIEELLSQKASSDSVATLLSRVNADIDNLANNYTNNETLLATYATKELVNSLLNLESEDSFISLTLSQYYNKTLADDKFVTKESLGGNLEGLEGENFVFVTSAQYAVDLKNIQDLLDGTVKTNSEGVLESIIVKLIKSSNEEESLIIDVKSEGLYINDEIVALQSEVPNIITLSLEDYDSLVENNELIENAYYYIYDNNETYVTLSLLQELYDSRSVYLTYVTQTCYRRSEVDSIIDNLQNYIFSGKLSDYYTSAYIDSNYLTALTISETYTTKQELSDLLQNINENFVTVEMLKGENSEDDDFMFVTLNLYTSDKEELALEFLSETINATTLKTSVLNIDLLNITANEAGLLIDELLVAYVSKVPKIECITLNIYDLMLEEGNLQEDIYYYTYNDNENDDNIYITLKYLKENYVSKSEVALMIVDAISPLKDRIASLEAFHNNE